MKKKSMIVPVIAIFVISAFVCFFIINNGSTHNNASPDVLFEKNSAIDMVVYNNTPYVYATEVTWVNEFTLTPDIFLGEVQRTDVKRNFRDFDATKLSINTKIYSSKERKDVILVLKNGEYIPYLEYKEG